MVLEGQSPASEGFDGKTRLEPLSHDLAAAFPLSFNSREGYTGLQSNTRSIFGVERISPGEDFATTGLFYTGWFGNNVKPVDKIEEYMPTFSGEQHLLSNRKTARLRHCT